ncbi:hypothetical protein KC352_g46889 [Hortaea werneckii]|nr:hypothetical protein KC352_g46889 [Hortaea werneckii]
MPNVIDTKTAVDEATTKKSTGTSGERLDNGIRAGAYRPCVDTTRILDIILDRPAAVAITIVKSMVDATGLDIMIMMTTSPRAREGRSDDTIEHVASDVLGMKGMRMADYGIAREIGGTPILSKRHSTLPMTAFSLEPLAQQSVR